MRPLGILVTGEPVAPVRAARGDFPDLIRERAGSFAGGYVVADARRAPSGLPARTELSGLVITGSPASVTERAPWMRALGEYLGRAVHEGVPVLGICFGHQLLAEALGGRVTRNPRGREIGTSGVEVLDRDPLFSEDRPFLVNQTHVDSVEALPPGARLLARSALDPHAAFRFGEWAWGVQFHPEFDGEVIRGYISARAEILAAEGQDVAELCARSGDALPGAEVLRRFVRLISERLSPAPGRAVAR